MLIIWFFSMSKKIVDYTWINGLRCADDVLSLAERSHSLDLNLKLYVVDLAPDASFTYLILYPEEAFNILILCIFFMLLKINKIPIFIWSLN